MQTAEHTTPQSMPKGGGAMTAKTAPSATAARLGTEGTGGFPHIPLLLVSLGPSLETQCVNPAVESLLGFTPEETAGDPCWFLHRVHPRDRDAVREKLLASFAEGSAFIAQCRLLARSGRVLHGLLQASPVQGVAERPFAGGLDVVFVDISERVKLETRLVHDEKLKTLGAISAEIVHEVRNPLMAVAGFARRLQKKMPESPEVEIILTEAGRLERLLKRITDYLAPVRFNREACSINGRLTDCLALLSPEMEQKGVWCVLSLDPDLPQVTADPEALSQVFLNCLRNAVEALPAAGVVHVRTYAADGEVRAEFKNALAEGARLDPETLFLPFDEGGEHIGLPLCGRLMEQMSGHIAFAEDLGEAVFTVSLPLSGDGQAAASPRAATARQHAACFEADSPLLSEGLFRDAFTRMVRTAARRRASVGLLLLECDDREAGAAETCIAALGAATDGLLTPAQMAGRFGPGEVGVLLPDVDAAEAAKVAAVLGRRLAETFPAVALGGAVCRPDGVISPREMVETAKKALYLSRTRNAGEVLVLDVQAEA